MSVTVVRFSPIRGEQVDRICLPRESVYRRSGMRRVPPVDRTLSAEVTLAFRSEPSAVDGRDCCDSRPATDPSIVRNNAPTDVSNNRVFRNKRVTKSA